MPKTIIILAFPVGKPPEVREIADTLEAMQAQVGGYIELVPLVGGPVEVCCNEEGKLKNLSPNRRWHGDVLCGDFFVTRTNPRTGESQSLTAEDIADATAYFAGLEVS